LENIKIMKLMREKSAKPANAMMKGGMEPKLRKLSEGECR